VNFAERVALILVRVLYFSRRCTMLGGVLFPQCPKCGNFTVIVPVLRHFRRMQNSCYQHSTAQPSKL